MLADSFLLCVGGLDGVHNDLVILSDSPWIPPPRWIIYEIISVIWLITGASKVRSWTPRTANGCTEALCTYLGEWCDPFTYVRETDPVLLCENEAHDLTRLITWLPADEANRRSALLMTISLSRAETK